MCLICHFNACVRRFNVWHYPIPPQSRLPCYRCLWLYGVALSSAPWLAALAVRCQLAPIVRRPCAPVTLWGGGLLRWRGLGGLRWLLRRAWLSAKVSGKISGKVSGKVAKVAGIVAVKVASGCAKVAHLPQNYSRLQNSVYKGGIFLAHFPIVNGKSCKSRSVSAHFTSKSLASMYFCWSCSGVKPSICGWFGVKTISCLSTMP